MDVLKAYTSAETEVKNSRFIAEAFPIAGQQEARELLRAQKQRYPDAAHVVHAFAAGTSGSAGLTGQAALPPVLGCSDDGEPPGTAGRPVLEVLKGRGVTNILLTVTRYFGGTLLGTGGLVKAYGNAAKAVLDIAETLPSIPVRRFSLAVSYELYERVKRCLAEQDAEISGEEFGEQVDIAGSISEDRYETLAAGIREFSAGRYSLRERES
jgi:uncharacterized YigZ family protein